MIRYTEAPLVPPSVRVFRVADYIFQRRMGPLAVSVKNVLQK
jgi:hypothetical protein